MWGPSSFLEADSSIMLYMPMPRVAKQFLYGLFFIAFFYGLVFGVYHLFLKPAGSCFDMAQNQGEEGVDCGMACGNICLPADVQPIEVVGYVQVFHPSLDRVSALAKIQNANAGVGARHFGYEIRFYDEAGNVLRAERGDSFIYPREIKYLAHFADASGLEKASRADMIIQDPQWVTAGDFAEPHVAIVHYSTSGNEKVLMVEGRVLNEDTISFPTVTILAFFYGDLGQIVGVSKAELTDLAPKEARDFTIAHPVVPRANTSKADVFVTASR